jgi:hypothetical protein
VRVGVAGTEAVLAAGSARIKNQGQMRSMRETFQNQAETALVVLRLLATVGPALMRG